MDQPTIQARINHGNAIATRFLGAPFTQYRPTSVTNPVSGTPVATLQCAFDPDAAFSFARPSGYSKPIYYGLFDGTNVRVGDYLVSATQGTFFVAGYEPIKPWLCASCNRTLTIKRTALPPATGLDPNYSGRTWPTDTSLMTGWPASILQGTKGEQAPASLRLPGDAREPWWNILLPAYPGVILNMGDHATDDLARGYTISSAELTGLGWRLTASLAST